MPVARGAAIVRTIFLGREGDDDATRGADRKDPRHQAREGLELEIHLRRDRRIFSDADHRGAARSDEADEAAGAICRCYELVMVYGTTWKELIQEEFGDGIMSAIDFDIVLERLPNPKGDRVKITMLGKIGRASCR